MGTVTYTVTSLDGSGYGISLADAIYEVDSGAGGPGASYVINFSSTQGALPYNWTLTADLPAISLPTGSSLVINGAAISDGVSEGNNTISGGGVYRGFLVYSGNVEIENLNLVDMVAKGGNGGTGGGGGGAGLGGAVFVAGTNVVEEGTTTLNSGANVTLYNVGFNSNTAEGGNGGAANGNGAGGGGGMGGNGGNAGSSLTGGGGGGGIGSPGGGQFSSGSGGSGSAHSGNGGQDGIVPSSGISPSEAKTAGFGGSFINGNPTFFAGGGSGGGGGGAGVGGGGGVGGYRAALTGGGNVIFPGAGGFGGGGGGDPMFGANGGFGGGGGGASVTSVDLGTGGNGGFGGGGGGGRVGGAGGYGGGNGSTKGGGGGLGAGGDVFVQAGGTLTIEGGSLTNGTSSGGTGAGGSSTNGGNGDDSGIFAQGTLNLDPSYEYYPKYSTTFVGPVAVTTTTIDDVIADEPGTSGDGVNVGGGGTLTLAAANTYTGGTKIEGGTTLSISADDNIGPDSGGVIITGNGATLAINGSFSFGHAVTIDGGGTLSAPGNVKFTNTVTINSGGVLEATGDSSFANTIALDGELEISNGVSFADPLNVSGANGLLVITGETTYNLVTSVTGTGTLSFGGADIISLASDEFSGFNGTINLTGNTLDLTSAFALANAISLSSSGTFDIASGETTTLSGLISGGTLVVNGGILTLSHANNTYGATTIETGTLDVAALNAAGTGPISFTAGDFSTLKIENAALSAGNFGNTITNFVSGDEIDLVGLQYNSNNSPPSYNATTGQLSVTVNGVTDTLTLSNIPFGATFSLSDDGTSAHGTVIQTSFNGTFNVTTFNVGNENDLNSVIEEIDSGGVDAKTNTAYTVNLIAGFTLSSGALDAINLLSKSSLTINGTNGAGGSFTINGNGNERGFFVYAGTLNLENLNITDAVAQGGAGSDGGGGGAGLGGGLFVAAGANASIDNVNFTGNKAIGGAGSNWVGAFNAAGGGGGGMGTPGGNSYYLRNQYSLKITGGAGGGLGLNNVPGSGGGAGGDLATKRGAAGGFGGGGGGSLGYVGGAGGFGGGGGATSSGGNIRGGNGGFGGGGGGFSHGGGGTNEPGVGGFGAGNGSGSRGGGGLGAGGDIFVEQGGSLSIAGGYLSGGYVAGGNGGAGSSNEGSYFGSGIFIEGTGTQTVTFDPAAGQTLTIDDVIADQTGSGGTGNTAGAAALTISGPGTVVLKAKNTFTGGTTMDAGVLELGALGAAGAGAIIFAANVDTTLTIANAALASGGTGVLTFTGNTIKGFAIGDFIDLSGATFSSAANPPTLTAGNLLQFTENGTIYKIQFDPNQIFSDEAFELAQDDGTGTKLELVPGPSIGNTGNTVQYDQSQGTTGTSLDSAMTVTDLSGAAITSATVTITNANGAAVSGDTLSFDNGNTTETFNDGAAITATQSGDQLSLSTTAGTATAADYQEALASVTYSFSGDPTDGGASGDNTRTITWSVTDASNLSNNGISQTTLDVYMTPALAGGAGFATPVVTTSTAVAADPDLAVTDFNTTGSVPKATVSIGSPLAGDELFIPAGDLSGNTIKNTTITVSGNDGTTLTLTGTAGTSPAEFQTALQEVAFAAASNGDNGTPTLTWSFNDDAGNITNNSNSLQTSIDVELPPTVGGVGNTAQFYQNSTNQGLTLDGNITVTDPNVDITGATVTITSGYEDGDGLGAFFFAGSQTFGDGATITGQFVVNAQQTAATLTLTTTGGDATAADYQTALAEVQFGFNPVGSDPTFGGTDKALTIAWSITDANGQTSAAGNTTALDLYALPIVTVGAAGTPTQTYISGPVTADSTLSITDYNGTTLAGATVAISGGVASDTLTINGETSGTINDGAAGTINYSFAASTLTLTGADTVADYITALDKVQFSAVSPNSGTRTLTWTVNDGAGGNANDSPAVTSRVDVTFGPQIGGTGNTVDFDQAQASPEPVDGTITLNDPAGNDIASATVTITNAGGAAVTGDTLAFNDGTDIETFGDGATVTATQSGDILTLTTTSGGATAIDYQLALASVTYAFAGDPTVEGADPTRTVTWSVTDTGGLSNVPGSTSTIDVFGLPVIGKTANTVDYDQAQASPATIDSGLTLSDPNGAAITGAAVTITNASGAAVTGDTLAIGPTPGTLTETFGDGSLITASQNGDVLSLTTVSGNASVADYQQLLESVTYSFAGDPTNNGADPTRIISWSATDADGLSSATGASSTIDVFGLPVIANTGNTVDFDQGQASPTTIDSGVTLSDPNGAALTGATVTITNAGGAAVTGDTLAFNNGTDTETFGDGSVITAAQSGDQLTLATTSGNATASDYQAALASITYSFSGDPTVGGADRTRTVTWSATDADNLISAAGSTSTIDVFGQPVIADAGNTVTFNQNGSPVTLDGGITLFDPNGAAIAGATLTLTGTYSTDDVLADNGVTDDVVLGNISASYNSTTQVLTLSGTDTVADYDQALQDVTYSFPGDPTNAGANPSRTVAWSVTDTDGQTSAAGSTTIVDVTHAPPVITAGSPNVTFAGGSFTAVTLDAGVAVSDVISTGDLVGATVTIGAANLQPGDTLSFNNTADVETFGDGNTIAAFYANGTLDLSGSATVAEYQTALSQVQFSFDNTATALGSETGFEVDPTAGGTDLSRTITWQVSDIESQSAPSNTTLDLTHTAPTVNAAATATFTGGGSPVTLDGTLTLNDPDSGDSLTGATVSISTGLATGDVLNFTDTPSITGSYDAASGVLTLTGTDTVADYQAALQSITYGFTPASDDPSAGGSDANRTISWTVTDGSAANGTSNTATSTLDTVHVAPTVTAGAAATFTGGGPAVGLDGSVVVSDPDSGGNLTGATVAIGTGFTAGDLLSFTAQNNITGSYDAATGVLTLTGTSSVADYQTALDSISYSFNPSNGDPTAGGRDTGRTISWLVTDGSGSDGTSNAATSTLAVVHTPPILSAIAGTAATALQGGPAITLLAQTPAVTDADDAELAGATVQIVDDVAGDTLAVNTGGTAISVASNVNGTLTLTGADTFADYAKVLATVTYQDDGNDALTPGESSRTVAWSVTDGVESSVADETTFTVDQPPTIAGAVANQITVAEALVSPFSGVTLSDLNTNAIDTLTITLSSTSAKLGTLSGTGLTGSGGTYELVGPAATITAELDSLSYTPVNGVPNTSVITTFTLTDQSSAFATATTNDATTVVDTDLAAPPAPGINFPHTASSNVDEWVLTDGEWVASAEPGSMTAGYQVAGIGDFTGDGFSDILWQNASTGDTQEWLINNGSWAGTVDLGAHPGNYQIAGVGDFFGNGIDDVLWTSATGNGTVATDIWELSSDGNWMASVSPGSHPAGYNVVAVGDFTGNGTSDILWQNPTTGDVDEWLINNGQWAGSVDLGAHPGTGWSIAGVGAFTGNGSDDILWTNATGGMVQTDIWELGSNGQWVASASPGSHPAGYQVAAVGNFTGNGTAGVLWYSPTSGDVDEWVLNGANQWAESIDLGAHPGNFQIAGTGAFFNGNSASDILWHSSP